MKIIFLAAFLFFFSVSSQGALYTIVVVQKAPLMPNLCPGDTIRFSGDSLNNGAYGMVQVWVENVDSTLNFWGVVSSGPNLATTCDRILLPGDVGWYFQFTYGNFTFNCLNSIFSDATEKSRIEIYPNPSSGKVFISSDQNIDEVIVFDVTGHEMMRLTSTNRNESIDISSLSAGVFMMEIKTEAKSVFKRLIKD